MFFYYSFEILKETGIGKLKSYACYFLKGYKDRRRKATDNHSQLLYHVLY